MEDDQLATMLCEGGEEGGIGIVDGGGLLGLLDVAVEVELQHVEAGLLRGHEVLRERGCPHRVADGIRLRAL